jgi:hypothetical protein
MTKMRKFAFVCHELYQEYWCLSSECQIKMIHKNPGEAHQLCFACIKKRHNTFKYCRYYFEYGLSNCESWYSEFQYKDYTAENH